MGALREITFAGRKRAAAAIARTLAIPDNLWRAKPYVSDARPIIIGGCPRSGTTLLRVMLDSHPDLCCGPESNLFLPHRTKPALMAARFDMDVAEVRSLVSQCGSKAEFIEKLFARFAEHQGKRRWAEKTPANVLHMDWIFSHFPNARFIHMIRDGRDTICSLRTHPRHRVVNGELVKVNTNNPIGWCIRQWVRHVSAGMAYHDDARCRLLHYRDLVRSPERTLRELMTFMDAPWDDAVLQHDQHQGGTRDVSRFPQNPEATRPISAGAIGRWREDLVAEEIEMFNRKAGPLAEQLGYEIESPDALRQPA